VESGDLSGLSGNLSDSYHASGIEPCIFSPSQVVRDLVESDEVSDLSAIMSKDLEDTNTHTDNNELLCAELDLSMLYSLECLKHPDLWIGHTTRYKMHGFNFCVGSSSVGATWSAVDTECSMDIRGQFVNRDNSLGIVATLTDVGFNLLSVTSLWQQGWSTQSGDSEGLSIIGPDGGSVINFDIVYVGCFVRLERANPTTKPRKMSILAAHRMLVSTRQAQGFRKIVRETSRVSAPTQNLHRNSTDSTIGAWSRICQKCGAVSQHGISSLQHHNHGKPRDAPLHDVRGASEE
jgi:hypothetical protein